MLLFLALRRCVNKPPKWELRWGSARYRVVNTEKRYIEIGLRTRRGYYWEVCGAWREFCSGPKTPGGYLSQRVVILMAVSLGGFCFFFLSLSLSLSFSWSRFLDIFNFFPVCLSVVQQFIKIWICYISSVREIYLAYYTIWNSIRTGQETIWNDSQNFKWIISWNYLCEHSWRSFCEREQVCTWERVTNVTPIIQTHNILTSHNQTHKLNW